MRSTNKQLHASARHLCLHMAQLLKMASLELGVIAGMYSRNDQGALLTLGKWSSHDDVRGKKKAIRTC